MFDFQRFNSANYNRKGFSEMYALCFGQGIDENYVKWKYQDNPAGPMIGYSAETNEITAGFYGVIPEKYCMGEKQFTVYQSMDTMTHPGFQKKGLFTTLAEKTYQTLLDEDPESLIIGIPGSNSYHGFVNKLGWKAIHHFSFTFIHKQLFRLFNPGFSEKKYSLKEITDFQSAEVDGFLRKIHYAPGKIQAMIDPSFLTWRITKNPLISYKCIGLFEQELLTGMVIYHITSDKKCFIDWIQSDISENTGKTLRSFCYYLFKKESIKYIYTWKPLEEGNLKSFRSVGFLSNPFNRGPFNYKVPFIIYSKTQLKNGVDLSNINNYNLQPIIQD